MNLRAGTRAAVLLMFALLGARLVSFLLKGMHALSFPFDLDYGEGIVWQQALLMFTPEAYGPIDGFPAIVFHYTPLYHVVTRALSALTGADMLYVGRAVSIGSAVVTALVLGLIVARAVPAESSRVARFLSGACGGLVIFSLWPVIYWAQLMRVDMLAILLSFTGFWLGMKAFERPYWVHAAALCFVAAVYTKQNTVAAPMALFGLMLWLKPRLAVTGLATSFAGGLGVLLALSWATEGGFIRHVFLYNVNHIEWVHLGMVVGTIRDHVIFFGIALIMAAPRVAEIVGALGGMTSVERRKAIVSDPNLTAFLGILIYFAVTTPMLLLILKAGAYINYQIEWLCTVALLVGVGSFDAVRLATSRGTASEASDMRLVPTFIGVPLFIAAQAWQLSAPNFNDKWLPERMAELESLSARVRAARKPIITDAMVLLLRNHQRVVWEPAIFAQLASTGVWDEKPLVARIRRNEFEMFITEGPGEEGFYPNRYDPAIADAMSAAYPTILHLAGYTLHLPADAASTPAKMPREELRM